MVLSIRTTVAALLLAVPLAAQTPTPATPATLPARPVAKALDYDSLAFARQLTTWFYAGEVDSLYAHSDSGMQANFPKEQWAQATTQWLTRAGSELTLLEERWVKRNGHRQYWRVMNVSGYADGAVMLRFVLEPGKRVAGVGMNPANQAPPVDPN